MAAGSAHRKTMGTQAGRKETGILQTGKWKRIKWKRIKMKNEVSSG
jgi:hypothetical protein